MKPACKSSIATTHPTAQSLPEPRVSAHLFTGKELDDSTGLYDYPARQYDPKLGRFITPDTVEPDLTNPQTLNRYSYTLNNPLKYVDETGHAAILAAALAIPGFREAMLVSGYLVLKWGFEQLSRAIHDMPSINLKFRLPGFDRSAKAPSAVESPSAVDLGSKPEGMGYTDMPDTSVMRAKEISKGATVYRQGKFSDKSKGWAGSFVKGKQWATDNPLTTPDYAKKYGLPSENTGNPDWVATGKIKGEFKTRFAPGSHNNPVNTGGATEVLPKNKKGIELDSFHMP